MVSGSEPAVIEDVVRPLRELLTFVLFGVVAVRLGQRIRGATPLTRRVLGPVLAVACFRCAAFCSATLGRRLAPESSVVDVSMWLLCGGAVDGGRVPGGPFALVGVHGPLDAAARCEARRAPHS